MKEPQIKAPRIASLQSCASEGRRIRIIWIRRIFMDIFNPCASVSSAQSVFYRKIAIFDDDKPQMNADERRYFHASNFNKIIHRKGRKERKVHRIISFGIRKTTEGTEDTEKKNKTLCSLCSPWLNNLAGVNYGGFDARALEYSIFTQGETVEEVRKNIIDTLSCHFDYSNDIISRGNLA